MNLETIEVRKLNPVIGAEIHGVDLSIRAKIGRLSPVGTMVSAVAMLERPRVSRARSGSDPAPYICGVCPVISRGAALIC